MATAQSFFNKDTHHGLIKRLMYKKYLQAYIPLTQKKYSTVIIDGFAGQGRYGQGRPNTIEEYGSPIIALIVAVGYLAKTHKKIKIDLPLNFDKKKLKLKWINDYRSNPNAKIILYFIEENKKSFRSLCKNVRTVFYSFLQQLECTRSRLVIEHGKGLVRYNFHMFLEHGPEIVLICNIQKKKFQDFTPPEIDTETTRCLTFLDPYGITHTPMNVVQNYAGKGREVLINFMSSFVNRFVSRYPSRVAELFSIETRHIKEEARQTGKSIKEVETEIADYVKHFIRQKPVEAKENHSVKNITINFEKVLRRKAGSDLSLNFEMRGKNNAIIYHLIFITSHIKGVKAMKESMCLCSQEKRKLGMSDYKIVRLCEELSLKNDQNPEDVASVIFKEFKGKTDSLENVQNFVLLKTPYLFRKKVLKLMEGEEDHPRLCQVRNINRGTTRARRAGSFSYWGKWELQFRDDDDYQNDQGQTTL